MEPIPQIGMNAIVCIVNVLDIAVKIFTIIGIITGGIWAYFNFIQGRIYYPRLESNIDLKLYENDDSYYLRADILAKNVGLSRIDFNLETSAIVFREYPDMGPVEDTYSVDTEMRAVFPVFERHKWIEPNEPIRDQRLIVVPKRNQIAFGANVRIVGIRHGRFGSRKSYEWNADRITFVRTDASSMQQPGAL